MSAFSGREQIPVGGIGMLGALVGGSGGTVVDPRYEGMFSPPEPESTR